MHLTGYMTIDTYVYTCTVNRVPRTWLAPRYRSHAISRAPPRRPASLASHLPRGLNKVYNFTDSNHIFYADGVNPSIRISNCCRLKVPRRKLNITKSGIPPYGKLSFSIQWPMIYVGTWINIDPPVGWVKRIYRRYYDDDIIHILVRWIRTSLKTFEIIVLSEKTNLLNTFSNMGSNPYSLGTGDRVLRQYYLLIEMNSRDTTFFKSFFNLVPIWYATFVRIESFFDIPQIGIPLF